jgi:MFS transporter, DHA1 family, multidrug resistance protein
LRQAASGRKAGYQIEIQSGCHVVLALHSTINHEKAKPMKQNWPIIYAGMLMSITAFSIDIILPAIPEMARDLGAPVSTVQLTISLFILALGLGQLFWGIMSDRYGRRPVIATGLGVYIVASIAAAFVQSAEALIICRVLQGVGVSSAGISARALIRDLHSGPALASAMATATAIFAIGPILGPFIGSALLEVMDWRAIFFALSVLAALLAAGLLVLPETLPTRVPVSFAAIATSTKAVFDNYQSRFFLLVGPLLMSTMIFILSMMPAVYAAEFGVEGFGFAALFALHGLGIIAGQSVNRILIRRIGVAQALAAGAFVLVIASGLMVLMSLTGFAGPISFALALVLFATSYLVVIANGTSLLLDPHGGIAAFTAALGGTVAQLGAGLGISLLVLIVQPTAMAFSMGLFALCCLSLIPALWWLKAGKVVHSAV